ncbi:MAG: hypothetical protein ACQEQV_08085 [Fibrobacterota bacterium]
MNILKKMMMALFFVSGSIAGGEYVLIVNPANGTESLNSAMVKRYYTGRASNIDGKKAVPVNLTLTTPTAQQFLSEMVGMSVQEYKEYWVDQQIKGAGSAPMVQTADAGVVSIVSTIPGALGYVKEESVTDAVKVIPVK